MKALDIQCFQSNYILPVGKTHSIIAGWEKDGYLFCERFTFLEDHEKEGPHSVCLTRCPKHEYELISEQKTDNILHIFMNNEGKQIAESDSQIILYKFIQSLESFKLNTVNIKFENIDVFSFLIFLKLRLPSSYLLLQSSTKSSQVKDIITKINSIQRDEF